MERYVKIYAENSEKQIIERFKREVKTTNLLNVMRHGFMDRGIKFYPIFWKPETSLNETTQMQYDANILHCTRQLHYSVHNENSIDIVLFANGIPVVSMELKCQFTGQDTTNAINQYKFDRAGKDAIFAFKERVLVHFAVDLTNVYMTTRLEGAHTYFLPFNQGSNGAGKVGGKGNPVNPNGYDTAYLWERVLCKDSLMEILQKYMHLQQEYDKNGNLVKETMIFPRYHQLDVVTKLLEDVKKNGSGKSYLIQHSAGSGKSNSIAWLAHRLTGLHDYEDNKIFQSVMQNPIGMLNALQKVSDKIVLFCEAGQIKVPTKPTALSILLEKMVVEVALPKDRQLGRYPAFHPKTWILAYVNAEGDKKYRFVVMSRNLTFDRSWDISFAMDSSKNVRQKKKTQPICDFLDYLVTNVHNTSNNAGKKRNLIRGLCADIKDVSFSLDSKIFGEDFEVLPLGIGKNAYRMQEDILFCKERGNANSTFNELVVMSPFLSESVIADFNLTDRALSDCKRTLVTRRSELGKLKASDVDNFTIYALKDEIIDGEEEISDELADKKKQDIHAKIYLRRKYSDVDLYLGSMNASYSAINKNVEMMLWLGTKNMYLNGDKFLEDIFCGPVGDAKNPFEQVTVADDVLETESDNRNLLEQKIKDLCRVKRQAVISEDNENAGKYKIEVEFSGIESDSEVTVSPFNSKQEQTLSEHIEFSELEILQLSEFYEITARSGDDTIRRIIMIPTSGFPDDRESAAVNSVVKDRASFVEYIAFVLGDDYVASMLEGKQMGESGFFANSSDAMPALYEKMLKTSVEGPERIKDIGYVLKMVTDKDIIPDEFRELYETFCNTLKIRR